MLGPQEPDTYLTATEVVHRLDRLAASRPVHARVTVTGLKPHLDGRPLRDQRRNHPSQNGRRRHLRLEPPAHAGVGASPTNKNQPGPRRALPSS